jgi:hypothetical protein
VVDRAACTLAMPAVGRRLKIRMRPAAAASSAAAAASAAAGLPVSAAAAAAAPAVPAGLEGAFFYLSLDGFAAGEIFDALAATGHDALHGALG